MERAKKTLKDYTVDGAIEWEKLIGKTIIYDVTSNGHPLGIHENKLVDILRVESLLKSRNITLLKFKSKSWLKAEEVTIYGIIDTPVPNEAMNTIEKDQQYRKLLEEFEKRPKEKPERHPLPPIPWYPPYNPYRSPYQKPYAPNPYPTDPFNPPFQTWC